MSFFNALFPLWAILISVLALFFAEQFSQMESLIVPLLSMVMFIMGLNLSRDDFVRVVANPKPIFIGV